MNRFNFLIAGLVVLFAVQLVSAQADNEPNSGLVNELADDEYDEADGGYGKLGNTPRVGGSISDIYGVDTIEKGNAKLAEDRQSVGCSKIRFSEGKCKTCCASKSQAGRITGLRCTCFQKAD